MEDKETEGKDKGELCICHSVRLLIRTRGWFGCSVRQGDGKKQILIPIAENWEVLQQLKYECSSVRTNGTVFI